MDEPALIASARSGDLDAFNSLVLKYQQRVYNVAYRMLGDSAGAEDATQEAFISAFKHIGAFRGGSFKAWLLRTATNACYDELRRQQRRPAVPLEDNGTDASDANARLTDPAIRPEDAVIAGELDLAIQHCLGELTPEFRSVIILVELEGLDYDEAARAAHAPIGTIRSRLARARMRLRDCLQGFAELLPSTMRLQGGTDGG